MSISCVNPDDRTHYQVLGIPPEASHAQIEGIYRRLRKIFLPESYPEGCPGLRKVAAEKLAAVDAAFEVLGNPEKRQRYNEELGISDSDFPVLPPDRLQRVLARSVASFARELLSQDPGLHWMRKLSQDFDLVAQAVRKYDRHELAIRLVPRMTSDLLEGYLSYAEQVNEISGDGLLRTHLTYVLASEIVEEESRIWNQLALWNRSHWMPLEGRGSRARVLLLLGPSGRIMAPGGVAMDAPVPHPRRLYRPNRIKAIA